MANPKTNQQVTLASELVLSGPEWFPLGGDGPTRCGWCSVSSRTSATRSRRWCRSLRGPRPYASNDGCWRPAGGSGLGQQIGQPLRNPLCDLVFVVGAADHESHVVDEGLQAIRFHGDLL
jgi:hypothetical protein